MSDLTHLSLFSGIGDSGHRKDDERMERLTTDMPLGIMQKCLNMFFARDGEAWVRKNGPGPLRMDTRLYDFIRQAIRTAVDEERTYIADFDDEDLGEIMLEWLYYDNDSVEGLIATLYTAAWAFAEIRERLKQYEDAEEQGRLIVLPCGGDVELCRDGCIYKGDHWNMPVLTAFRDSKTAPSGKAVALFSVEEAEAALKEGQER